MTRPDLMSLSLVAHGPAARESLWAAIDEVKADDPLAPVTVAVPSPQSGLSLRYRLAARGGTVNVRFVPLPRIAELLGAPSLAASGRRPLTRAIRLGAVRTVLRRVRPGPLRAASGHPATPRALLATFEDLRHADDASLVAVEARGERGASTVALYRAFRVLTKPFYDEHDLAVAAADAARAGSPALDELGLVVLHLPRRVAPAEVALLAALARAGRLVARIGLTGDPTADRPARELAARLAAATGLAPTEPRPVPAVLPTSVISAPDPDDEMREAVRRVLALAEQGVPLHRIALLFRMSDPYLEIARSVLDDAGIRWSGPSSRRLADGIAGRALLGLLALADTDLARDELGSWLTGAPLRDPGRPRNRINAHRWEAISRRAGVVRGLDQWRTRLDARARAAADELRACEADPNESGSRRGGLRTELEETLALAAFVEDLGPRLADRGSSWPELCAWAAALLDDYVGDPGGDWPTEEIEATRKVRDALHSLRAVEAVEPDLDLETFRRTLEAELDVTFPRVGRFGDGLFVGPLMQACGADFEAVIVVGVAEGTFPPAFRDDPLLPDADRLAADPELPLRATRRDEERADFLGALAAAPHRILTFPRADPRGQRKRLPARWLLESASALAGAPLGADDLSKTFDHPWFERVESFAASIEDAAPVLSLREHDLGSLSRWRSRGGSTATHPLVQGAPALTRGTDAARSRLAGRFTRFDGLVGPADRLRTMTARPVSATALEAWATCPFEHLLARVLRVAAVERPEELDTITPLERGSLIHDILERFVRAHPPARPDHAWTDDERAALDALAAERFADAEARGVTGRRVRWALEQRRVRRHLQRVLDVDERARARSGVVPAVDLLELVFGAPDSPEPPLRVTLPSGRELDVRGRIDRIDRAPDGSRFVVYDYKTGRPPRHRDLDDEPARGTRLQLPVYGRVAARLAPDAEVRMAYWYTASAAHEIPVSSPLDPPTLDRLASTLGTIVDGIEAGEFPAYPGDERPDRGSWSNCTRCDYDRLCPTRRGSAWDRMADDPRVARFRALAEPTA